MAAVEGATDLCETCTAESVCSGAIEVALASVLPLVGVDAAGFATVIDEISAAHCVQIH